MDTRNGQIYEQQPDESYADFVRRTGVPRNFLTPVRRDLTSVERLNRQVDLYAPCVCGSGRKFKFCCKAKH